MIGHPEGARDQAFRDGLEQEFRRVIYACTKGKGANIQAVSATAASWRGFHPQEPWRKQSREC
jgi:hypothetical protein